MISVPLRQILDALVVTPVAGSTAAPSVASAPAGDFSTILSGASVSPATTSANPSSATPTIAGQPQPLLPNGQDQASLTLIGETSRPARLTPTPTDADADADADTDAGVDADASDALAALSAKLIGSLVPHANAAKITRSCDASGPATDPKLAAVMGALQSIPLSKLTKRPAASSADASKPTDPKEEQSSELNPALLTIQQALVAAASLSPLSPSTAQPQVAQAEQKSPLTAAPLVSLNDLTTARGASLSDEKSDLADGGKPLERQAASQVLQSHDLASLLDQQASQSAPRSEAPRSALPAAHTIDASGQSLTSDLHQLDALVRDIAEVSGTSGRAALRLTAEQLGNLEIKLHRSDEGISVTIRTESEQAHSSVAQAQQQLSDDMRANGLKLTATSVMLGHGGAGQERHDRQGLPFAKPIEAAANETEASQTSNDERPDGRYA